VNEIWTTVCGNIVSDPTHRQTEDGTPIVKLRVASTPFTFQKGHGWVDGTTSYLTVTCFRTLAENAGGSLAKGDPIFAFGKLQVREYETRDGRTVNDTEIVAVTVGHDLSRGTSMFRRMARSASAPRARSEGDGGEFDGGEAAERDPSTAADASMIREPAELSAAGLGADFGRPAPAPSGAASAEADAA
jgi:single-strand DNA-binding protein